MICFAGRILVSHDRKTMPLFRRIHPQRNEPGLLPKVSGFACRTEYVFAEFKKYVKEDWPEAIGDALGS